MRRRVSALALALAAFASLATAAAAQTQKAVRPSTRLAGPIKITAERAELERREYALYRGRVKLVSQDMVLTGDRLELRMFRARQPAGVGEVRRHVADRALCLREQRHRGRDAEREQSRGEQPSRSHYLTSSSIVSI